VTGSIVAVGVTVGEGVGGGGGPTIVGAGAAVFVGSTTGVRVGAALGVNVGQAVQVGGQVGVGDAGSRYKIGPIKLKIMVSATTAEIA
jgi:hypothetical protein